MKTIQIIPTEGMIAGANGAFYRLSTETLKTLPYVGSALHIPLAGITHSDSNYRIYRPHSQLTVIEYVVRGEGFVFKDGKNVPITADSVYILHGGEDHYYFASPDDPWEKIFINLQGDLPETLLKAFGLADQWLFDGHGLRDLFIRVEEIVRREAVDPNDLPALAAVFFEAVMRLSYRNAHKAHNAEALALRTYLDSNTSRIVSNRELAATIYRSPDYCVKLFRREYQTSPYDYQINEKMRIAALLLRDTAMPIAQIAERVGYHDPCYFSGLFKRKQGISPREYRRQAQRK